VIMASAPVSGVPLMEGALVEGNWPEWFVASRKRGWEDFQKLPLPLAKDEKWRFSNVKALALDGFHYPGAVSDAVSLVERSTGLGESAARFVFGNNRLLSASAPAADLVKAGLVVMTLEEAATKHADLVQKHFMAQETKLGSAKFAALHRSGPVAGVFIRVPKDLVVEKPRTPPSFRTPSLFANATAARRLSIVSAVPMTHPPLLAGSMTSSSRTARS